jgi:hypothetical protein
MRSIRILLGLIALVVAFDANAYTVWRRFQVTISGTPATSDAAGKAYSFTPQASSPFGRSLTFSISGKPSWASFSSRTGQLSGTPTAVGRSSNIVIRATDGFTSAALGAFSISVTGGTNAPPTISGTPVASVAAGATYNFTPSAADPNHNTLTFSIQNKPSWATFTASSGQLTGTPSASYAGTYANIVISVSDGMASASLAPFSIAVNTSSNGTATVNWVPPLNNTDGTVLAGLSGYRIHYGTTRTALNQTIQVANAGLSSYTLSNLASGTWYFGVSAYTSSGVESTLSNLASKTIP